MKKEKCYSVYILASVRNGTLYIGVTGNLRVRIWQHKSDSFTGFTNKYGVHLLVYYEQYADVRTAIHREKQIKRWRRKWKLRLIEKSNPYWWDLYDEITS